MDSLLLPTVYLGGCLATMSIFSFVYRRITGMNATEPWFPPNQAKERYIALLNTESEVPEYHLKAALLQRAMEAVSRLVVVQQEKPALQQLMRAGSAGDDIWRDFLVAEQEVMMELQEISQEANSFVEGWGKAIFTTAAQMVEYSRLMDLQTEMKGMRETEEKRMAIQQQRDQMMTELQDGKSG